MREICFATNNKHKLEEVRSILGPDFRVLSLHDLGFNEELPETRNTFEGNSSQKAEYLFNRFKMPCFADDSGLEVASLKGEPGVFSARYAGEHKNDDDNIELLLKNLKGKLNRNAQFRTIITYIDQPGDHRVFEGIIRGKIIDEKKGSSGFGYDPVFVPQGYEKTFAQMDPLEKNAISHRSKAVKKLVKYLLENSLQ